MLREKHFQIKLYRGMLLSANLISDTSSFCNLAILRQKLSLHCSPCLSTLTPSNLNFNKRYLQLSLKIFNSNIEMYISTNNPLIFSATNY